MSKIRVPLSKKENYISTHIDFEAYLSSSEYFYNKLNNNSYLYSGPILQSCCSRARRVFLWKCIFQKMNLNNWDPPCCIATIQWSTRYPDVVILTAFGMRVSFSKQRKIYRLDYGKRKGYSISTFQSSCNWEIRVERERERERERNCKEM